LTKEAESLRVELKEKKTQADKREDEASSQREQLNKLLEMVNDKVKFM
jgi:trehalose-6-phosphatase